MSIFITGTDTDVGKTVVTSLLLAAMRANGVDAVPMKPVQTGCEFGVVPDFAFYEKISQTHFEDQDLQVPYKYEPACSPHLAAKLAGEQIELNKIEDAFKKLSSKHQQVLVEGAGGIMVPLNENELMLDLMKKLNLPVLLVARPSLGTINHTLLSVAALRSAGLKILGVIVVDSYKISGDLIESDNLKSISEYGEIPVLAHIPYIENIGDADFSYTVLSREIRDLLAEIIKSSILVS